MPNQHWMINVVRMVALLFVMIGCFLVFWYTPFYSNLVVKTLNTFVPYEVDEVAAQSQKMAALTETENLEPGSDEWVARQAYLDVIEQTLKDKKTDQLALIQARYVKLKQQIKLEKQSEQQAQSSAKFKIPLVVDGTSTSEVDVSERSVSKSAASDLSASEATGSEATGSEAIGSEEFAFDWLSSESDADKALKEKFEYFLQHHPIEIEQPEHLDTQIYKDIAHIQNQNESSPIDSEKPYAIVILGGGLTLGSNKIDIVVNEYTRLRLEKTLEIEKQTQLPIVLSGVEAPYMQAWLANKGVEANLLENRSMNTCENTRFSSLLLQKKGGAPTVLLITDRYHMPRTRRLFALNGIQTIPVEAPMPTALTDWKPSKQNYDHSRRANYELLATIRDVLFGSSGCREVP